MRLLPVWLAAAAALYGVLPCRLDPKCTKVTPGRPAKHAIPTATAAPTAAPALADADVDRFLRQWPAFQQAMSTLGQAPATAQPAQAHDDLSDSELALQADQRLRDEMKRAGADPDEFLDLYLRVSGAWFAMVQADDHAAVDDALESELADLRKVSGTDASATDATGLPTGARAAGEISRADQRLHSREVATPSDVPASSIALVRRRAAELGRIFAR